MNRFFKFKYLPVFALVLAGGLALASHATSPKKNRLVDYDVASETSTYYQLGTPPDGCGSSGALACGISTTLTPDANNRIPKGPDVEVTSTRPAP